MGANNNRNILRDFCIGFSVLFGIGLCDAVSFKLKPGTKTLKGSTIGIICDIGDTDDAPVYLYRTETSNTQGITAFSICNQGSCQQVDGYNITQTQTSITVTILELSRDRDGKWWTCRDKTGSEDNFELMVYTVPKRVVFSSTKPCDLAIESCHFACQTSSCTSPEPSFLLYYTNATGGDTETIFGRFIQATGGSADNCIDEELKYTWPIRIPKSTTFPGNLAITIKLECRIQFSTLDYELKSQLSDPVQVAVAVEQVYILPEQGDFLNVTEGNSEPFSCITSGSRPASTVTWFKKNTTQTVNLGTGTQRLVTERNGLTVTNSTLMLRTTKADQGWKIYCEALSFGTTKVVARNPKELNILYPTKVKVFSASGSGGSLITDSLTVDEHEDVTGKCQVDSNPASSIEVSQRDTSIVRADNSKEVSFQILNATCFNNGMIECKGWNGVPGSTIAAKSLQLNVNCSPRPDHFTDPVVIARESTSAVLSLSILAYPAPSHDWHHLVDGMWKVVRNTTNVLLTSSSLQYNLTVMNVTRHLYGSYNLTLENGIGSPLTFTFSLQNKGKPDVAIDISVTVVSPTAITVAWTAGYDGEVQQQFYIQYKSSNARDWNTVEVADRKSDARLFVDINDLQPSTDYMLRIFSANAVGNSSLSETLTFRMKDPESSSLGAIIGGVVGGIVTVCLITVGIFCICRRNILPKVLKTKMFEQRPIAQSAEAESKGNLQQPLDECSYAVVNKTPGQKLLLTKGPLTDAENEQAGENYVNQGFKGDKTNSKTTKKNKTGKKQQTPKNLSHDGLQYADLSFDDNGKSEKRQKPKKLKPPEGVIYDAVQIGVVGDAYYIPQNEKSGSE